MVAGEINISNAALFRYITACHTISGVAGWIGLSVICGSVDN
jgi:hypothetical protein